METLHTPERLTNETMEQYRSRRRLSRLVAGHGRLLVGHKAAPYKVARRKLVAQIGIRQFKKAWRARIPTAVPVQEFEMPRKDQTEAAHLEPLYVGPATDQALQHQIFSMS